MHMDFIQSPKWNYLKYGQLMIHWNRKRLNRTQQSLRYDYLQTNSIQSHYSLISNQIYHKRNVLNRIERISRMKKISVGKNLWNRLGKDFYQMNKNNVSVKIPKEIVKTLPNIMNVELTYRTPTMSRSKDWQSKMVCFVWWLNYTPSFLWCSFVCCCWKLSGDGNILD